MSAILFGSISTVVDTSELQREAFNQAFRAHGLDWTWDVEDYRSMLATSGGQDRIAEHAQARGESVDARAVHETKSRIFQENLSRASLVPRDGVVDAVAGARSSGWKVGLVTTTSPANVSAVLDALRPHLDRTDFDVVVDADDVAQPKPDQAAYAFALRTLQEEATACVAIEDNVDGVAAATASGVTCVAFPNENTGQHDFSAAQRRVDRLDVADLQQLVGR